MRDARCSLDPLIQLTIIATQRQPNCGASVKLGNYSEETASHMSRPLTIVYGCRESVRS